MNTNDVISKGIKDTTVHSRSMQDTCEHDNGHDHYAKFQLKNYTPNEIRVIKVWIHNSINMYTTSTSYMVVVVSSRCLDQYRLQTQGVLLALFCVLLGCATFYTIPLSKYICYIDTAQIPAVYWCGQSCFQCCSST